MYGRNQVKNQLFSLLSLELPCNDSRDSDEATAHFLRCALQLLVCTLLFLAEQLKSWSLLPTLNIITWRPPSGLLDKTGNIESIKGLDNSQYRQHQDEVKVVEEALEAKVSAAQSRAPSTEQGEALRVCFVLACGPTPLRCISRVLDSAGVSQCSHILSDLDDSNYSFCNCALFQKLDPRQVRPYLNICLAKSNERCCCIDKVQEYEAHSLCVK